MRTSRRALLLAGAAGSRALAQRPRYGGTLVVAARFAIHPFTADPLVFQDPGGRIRPALATEWSSDRAGRRWQFILRTGVRTHEGETLAAARVAGALETRLAGRKISADGSNIVVEAPRPMPRLLGELAQPAAVVPGTGPFRTASYDPDRQARLEAFDDYWGGRSFLDAIELRFGGPPAEQVAAFTLGRAHLAELPPSEMRRQTQRGARIWTSAALDLIALQFPRDRAAVRSESVRRGLAAALDRAPIVNVILQKQGEAAASLLPHSVSGYGFLFPLARDLASARRLLASGRPELTLACDDNDPVLRPIADRFALNAREAGAMVRIGARLPADILLRRIPGRFTDPYLALDHYAGELGLAVNAGAASIEDLFAREEQLLEGGWVVPVCHVPMIYGISTGVMNWPSPGTPPWRFENVWMKEG